MKLRLLLYTEGLNLYLQKWDGKEVDQTDFSGSASNINWGIHLEISTSVEENYPS